ncbi:MAG: YnfA family protein [Solirubrobacterales bacterium]
MTGRSILLFVAAAIAEIGGAYLVWIGIKDDKGALFILLGVLALGLYGVVAAFQPDANFGRVLAAYGGVFIVGSLAWGMAFDGFRPDRFDLAGAAVCLVGVAVIMYAPRG